MPELDHWDSFYVIVGSSAGALIGLQFVVMTLVAERPPPRAREAGAAFGTPTVIHFSAALLLSALLRVPWPTTTLAAVPCLLVGLAGTAYQLRVIWRMKIQTAYAPDFEDWLCHALLPLAAYAGLALSGYVALSDTRAALFGVGGAALLLLFVGIHNAWDAVAYHVYASGRNRE
jgi:hypothetical protein